MVMMKFPVYIKLFLCPSVSMVELGDRPHRKVPSHKSQNCQNIGLIEFD